jgi:hypothetical protein
MRIPNGNEDKKMVNTTECLYLNVTAECTWCFSDPLNVFNGTLPPTNSTLQPGPLGPFIPISSTTPGNEVKFNAVPGANMPCGLALESEHHHHVINGPHTITVG